MSYLPYPPACGESVTKAHYSRLESAIEQLKALREDIDPVDYTYEYIENAIIHAEKCRREWRIRPSRYS
jgi:hypothetical protein